MNRFVVIMAGGSGTRLWPLSREIRPKQFIKVGNGSPMLVQTLSRFSDTVPAEHCFIVTSKHLKDITIEAIKGLIPEENIIIEPKKKNTAACIEYATRVLKKKFGDGLLCFVPADGYVKDKKAYREAIELAYEAAEKTSSLVVVGITPTYPATGYGYIQIDKDKGDDQRMLKVQRFIEKPDLETAKAFLASGEFLWNGGILVGSMNAILDSVKTFLPEHDAKIGEAVRLAEYGNSNSCIEAAYNEIKNISFDNGVLEKINCIYVIKGLFDWDDIGSIDALSKTLEADTEGNIIEGKHVGLDTTDSIIFSGETLITTIGINNLIIVNSGDAIIVCSRDRAQEVRGLVELLKRKGYEEFL